MSEDAGELNGRVLDARPDTIDFRDQLFVPTLVEVPQERPLEAYLQARVPVLNQGSEGACTGFGLATVAHYLLRTRQVRPDASEVSPRMLYELARRYDEWPGEDYSGSSCRGAMKGWHKHGVCAAELWLYEPGAGGGHLTPMCGRDAAKRPLGAYFRVNHLDLVAMHAALAEVGVLYASADVHPGWEAPDQGYIRWQPERSGGHAFAIVGYDEQGFWLQNSWGEAWGAGGCGHLSYDDWLANGTDVWVARLGVPVELGQAASVATRNAVTAGASDAETHRLLRPHYVLFGNDGRLATHGAFGTTAEHVREIFDEHLPAVTVDWPTRRILLYAHGGLVSAQTAMQRLADVLPALLANQVYPVSLIWRSDLWTTIGNILTEAIRGRRTEGLLTDALDFMLDRVDDTLEPLVRGIGGKALWDEMKENALLASAATGGAALVLAELDRLLASSDAVPCEVHLAGHSAGSIFLAPMVQLLTGAGSDPGLGRRIASCTLWAPACTMELFQRMYRPALDQGGVERFALFTLTEQGEEDDHCAHIYHKSLLYLVSNALEQRLRPPGRGTAGTPLLGMARFVRGDPGLTALLGAGGHDWVRAGDGTSRTGLHSGAASHGAFDDDETTLWSTLRHLLGREPVRPGVQFHRSAETLRARRQGLLEGS